MVHSKPSERKESKPRGRPFSKGNKRGRPKNSVLDVQGHAIGNDGEVVAKEAKLLSLEALKAQVEAQALTEGSPQPVNVEDSREKRIVQQNNQDSESVPVESIEFKHGKDTLKITLYKKHNRMYRVQIFLNEETEIRPVTYTGASMAFGYWNLLKCSLKGE